MKKFLSLVLSLAMTISLVTISAGATDYKDLTDKGEIQYEEAVAVLNKLGIITGYEDGSFKPTGALTRGAAAKIIVSLMIGSEAAANLTVAAAPYKDVPVTNTFAAVISYCKTAGYINGYTDGTFRPTAALTGYAFTKMLLGAIGYDGVQEGFTGSGWTMNVAKLGNTAGLFNDFATAFSGNAGVDRQSACLLALNTLKATEVEYSGGTNITTTTGNATTNVSTQKTRSYKVSNNTKINKNISDKKTGDSTSDYPTLEFGEEHFTDLKLTADGTAHDDFGRPANEWSYKNVKIGTYAKTPDYVFTADASGDTNADKVKDMGLKDLYFGEEISTSTYKTPATQLFVNGVAYGANVMGDLAKLPDKTPVAALQLTDGSSNEAKTTTDKNAAILANYVKDGNRVEVYLDGNTSNRITTVVVVKTQMMQVNAVKSTEVTLKKLGDDSQNGGTTVDFKSVNAVKSDDDCFTALKDLKVDDYVLVVPVNTTASGTGNYDVNAVAIPQTVTGTMTNIATKSSNTAVKSITVAGTAYKMSNMWTSEDDNLTVSTKLSSSKDATVYLDTYGYAIYVKDVTDTKSAIIVDEIYSSMVDGKIVKYAKGWDSNGTELSLNLGTSNYLPSGYDETTIQGQTFAYEVSTSNSADYKLVAPVSTSTSKAIVYAPTAKQNVLGGAYNANITQGNGDNFMNFDANVKFIFLSKDDSDVTGITVNNGVTEVGSATNQYNLTYILNKDCNKIVAVVIPNDNDAANTANLLYVQKVTGYTNNTDGKRVALFTAYINGEKVTDCQYTKDSLITDAFYTYSKNETTGVYSLTAYTKDTKATSVYSADVLTVANMFETGTGSASDPYSVSDTYFTSALGSTVVLNAKNATVIDLYTDDGVDYSSYRELKDAIKDNANSVTGKPSSFQVSYIFNGDTSTSGAHTVSYLFITKNNVSTTTYSLTAPTGYTFSTDGSTWNASTAKAGQTVYMKSTSTAGISVTTSGKFNSTAMKSEGDGVLSFTMPSAAVTSANFTDMSTTSIDQIVLDNVANKVYVDYTGAVDNDALVEATYNYFTAQGYTVTFDSAAQTALNGAKITLSKNGVPYVSAATVVAGTTANSFVNFKVNGVAKTAVANTLISAAMTVNGSTVKNGDSYVAKTEKVAEGANYTGDYVKYTAAANTALSLSSGSGFAAFVFIPYNTVTTVYAKSTDSTDCGLTGGTRTLVIPATSKTTAAVYSISVAAQTGDADETALTKAPLYEVSLGTGTTVASAVGTGNVAFALTGSTQYVVAGDTATVTVTATSVAGTATTSVTPGATVSATNSAVAGTPVAVAGSTLITPASTGAFNTKAGVNAATSEDYTVAITVATSDSVVTIA